MRRLTLMAAATVGTLALLATTATAQGWGRGRMTNLSSEDQQKVTDLHQKVRQAQCDLWTLQAQSAEAKKIEQKRAEVLRLRGELAQLMTDLPACPRLQAAQGAAPPQRGMGFGGGRGWCGGRGGGCGGAGPCWRW